MDQSVEQRGKLRVNKPLGVPVKKVYPNRVSRFLLSVLSRLTTRG